MTLQLEGRQEYVGGTTVHADLVEENRQLRIQVRQLDEALRLARIREQAAESGVKELRKILSPLHKALGAVFGEMDAMSIEDSAQPGAPSSNARTVAWQKWITKLGGHRASFLQALLDHGPSNSQQVKVAMGIARMATVYDTATQLSKLGLISKSGDRYSLKE